MMLRAGGVMPSKGGEFFRELEDGSLLVDCGPMLMNIHASCGGIPDREGLRQGAERALEVLNMQAGVRDLITRNIREIDSTAFLPPTIRRMIAAARSFHDPTVTPLICVAGASADEVGDTIFLRKEADKVIVNNGGDIAVRLRADERARIGVKADLQGRNLTHVIELVPKDGVGGVATSGFGGRSFTLGVANAVTVLAADAISADVGATLVGNAANVESPRVKRSPARELYPATDIPDLFVTVHIGDLDEVEVETALDAGIRKAEEFREDGLILGAFVAVKNHFRFTDSLKPFIRETDDLIAV